MNEIFLSYRQADDRGSTNNLYSHLVQAFGKPAIFLDVMTIPHGTDFQAYIEETMRQCTVVLVIIGPRWLDATNEKGRRLDQAHDPVRIEVETALRQRKRIIPVLIDDAPMPAAEALPESMRPLQLQNAAPLHNNQYFTQDINTLLDDIAREGVRRVTTGYIVNPPTVALPTLTTRRMIGCLSIPFAFFLMGVFALAGLGYFFYTHPPHLGDTSVPFPTVGPFPTEPDFNFITSVAVQPDTPLLSCGTGQAPRFTATITNSGSQAYTYQVVITGKDPAGNVWAQPGSDGAGTVPANGSAQFTVIPASTLCGDIASQQEVTEQAQVNFTPVGGIGAQQKTFQETIAAF
jgi:TIR domain